MAPHRTPLSDNTRSTPLPPKVVWNQRVEEFFLEGLVELKKKNATENGFKDEHLTPIITELRTEYAFTVTVKQCRNKIQTVSIILYSIYYNIH